MIDGSLALQKSIIATLRASAASSLVDGRIYAARPDQDQGLPFMMVENSDAVPFARGEDRGCSVTQQIDCWAGERDSARDQMARVREIVSAITGALGNTRPVIAGWQVAHLWIESASARIEAKNSARGIVVVRADMWPTP